MAKQTKTCPKCEADMTRGYLFDYGLLRSTVSLWFEGKPEKGVLGGSALPKIGTQPGQCLPTAAFRCTACSYLEFYADELFRPE